MSGGEFICMYKVLCCTGENKQIEECGFCFADTFAAAAKYLEDELYRGDLIEIRHMELLDACPILSTETWEAMRKELNE